MVIQPEIDEIYVWRPILNRGLRCFAGGWPVDPLDPLIGDSWTRDVSPGFLKHRPGKRR